MIQQGSAYWLKNQDSQNSHFNLLELASTQRAITNYVKILTGREIPVDFVDPRGDSMTDGESIEIASRISHKNVDEVVNTIITNVENSGNNNENNNNESVDIENYIQAPNNNEHRVIVDLAKLNNPEEIDKIYESLEKYCNLKRQTHWMCARHYACMDKYFSVPSIVLSSLSGIGSFLASIAYFEEYSTVFSVSVGVMASITTLFQSFSNAFEYSTRAEAHQNATEAFDQIITNHH